MGNTFNGRIKEREYFEEDFRGQFIERARNEGLNNCNSYPVKPQMKLSEIVESIRWEGLSAELISREDGVEEVIVWSGDSVQALYCIYQSTPDIVFLHVASKEGINLFANANA